MTDVTYLPGTCPRCGRALPPDAPEGLCAACLLLAGVETITRAPDEAESAVPVWSGSAGPPAAAGPRLTGGQVWGPYRIGRLLGMGGMGEVYEAEQLESGRRVALKVLRGRLRNADDRARFLREGQLAASVSHPHTVYIFGSEEIDAAPLITMELVPGGTLKDRVTAAGPLAPHAAVSAVLDIIGGLDAAQAAGILHRDVKPSNCFLDRDGTVKVGDFGLSISTLARDVHGQVFEGDFQGTPQFAPPEQLRGEPLDVRADIYAVGATLYYLLTGKPVFEAPDLGALVARVTAEPPVSPRRLRPEIPAGLAAVVLRCLAKAPADRPASYAALADALRPYASHAAAPARLGMRLFAGIADSMIAGFPLAVWAAWSGDMFTQTAPVPVYLWSPIVNAVYFLVLEGAWGASLGKRLFGLRVVTETGHRASWLRVAGRVVVFAVPTLLLGLTPLTGLLGATTATDAARALAGAALVAAIFSTARRRNGWAALHDLASGTRVVSRTATLAARPGVRDDDAPLQAPIPVEAARHYGPFVVASGAGGTTGGPLLIGFDPVLRRRVWIHRVEPGTPAVSAARRDVGRAGRLHWLTGRRPAGDRAPARREQDAPRHEAWDAFEAPGGRPFLAQPVPDAGWAEAKRWLIDLAGELAAAAHDGSMPALAFDRLWVRPDGRLVLLDFPAPGLDAPPGDRRELTPVALVSAVAARALPDAQGATAPMPLSARALLDRLRGAAPPALDDLPRALGVVAAIPDTVSRRRRAVPIALAAAPMVLLVVSAVLVLPALGRFAQQYGEMLGWLGLLQDPPAQSRLADPEIREALERYVAGRYGDRLGDAAVWNMPVMQNEGLRPLRETAAGLMARHPSVSPDDLARAAAIVSPEIAWMEERVSVSILGVAVEAGPIIVSTLLAGALVLVLACSLVSSILVPGGVVARMLGVAVVTRGGAEIGRLRSFARAGVAWLPAIVWLAYLATSPKLQGFVPAPPRPLAGAGLTIAVFVAGAAWTIARPARGPHDRVTRVWVVPR